MGNCIRTIDYALTVTFNDPKRSSQL